MSGRITRKRARCESTVSQELEDGTHVTAEAGIGENGEDSGRERDKEFWFQDGSVILVARHIEFRIFQGILADHSPVFKDMFSLPQPLEAAPASCPVVHVTDTPEDLRHLLRVYMPKTGPSPFVPDDPSFDVISATIRLGHKYQISKLVEHSIEYLKMYYTDNYTMFSKHGRPYWPPSFQAKHAIGVVNLARLTEESALLPVAFLICCTLGRDIVRGFQREDGAWEQLTLDDVGLYFEAKGKLVARRAASTVYVFDSEVAEGCADREGCKQIFHDLLPDLSTDESSIADPFNSVLQIHRKRLRGSLCFNCWSMLKAYDAGELREIWDKLPSFFGLAAAETGTDNAEE